MEEFLAEDNLNVNSERKVYEALLKWVCFNEMERLPAVKSLISQIRLPLLPKNYLTDKVMKRDIQKFEGTIFNSLFAR